MLDKIQCAARIAWSAYKTTDAYFTQFDDSEAAFFAGFETGYAVAELLAIEEEMERM